MHPHNSETREAYVIRPVDPRSGRWRLSLHSAQWCRVIDVSDLDQAIQEAARGGFLPCAAAFGIAERLRVAPDTVRANADGSGVRISLCQLGLFGYDAFGERRATRKLSDVPPELRRALDEAATDGRIACAAAWRLADERGLPRLLMGSAVETAGVRVSHCQLGCFD